MTNLQEILEQLNENFHPLYKVINFSTDDYKFVGEDIETLIHQAYKAGLHRALEETLEKGIRLNGHEWMKGQDGWRLYRNYDDVCVLFIPAIQETRSAITEELK